jgi:hypothetical protein
VNDAEHSPLWPADSPAATAHIALLQGIITRLANNSAASKTWCLTLVAALLSLAGAVHAPPMIHATLVPILVFGFVDIMYLATEVAYRDLYDKVVQTMREGTYGRHSVYDATARPDAGCIIRAISSWSIIPYYALLAFYVIAIASGWSAMLAVTPRHAS